MRPLPLPAACGAWSAGAASIDDTLTDDTFVADAPTDDTPGLPLARNVTGDAPEQAEDASHGGVVMSVRVARNSLGAAAVLAVFAAGGVWAGWTTGKAGSNGSRGAAAGPMPVNATTQQRPAAAGPLSQYTTYIVATHFLHGQSYETHHYFKHLREGVLQGLVFRENADGAPLIEVEWAISGDVFSRLPDWQKEFWHPLAPAVDAGRIRAPNLRPDQERELLGTVRGLYAQTINLAGIDGELPIGLEGIALATHITREEMLRALAAAVGR